MSGVKQCVPRSHVWEVLLEGQVRGQTRLALPGRGLVRARRVGEDMITGDQARRMHV